MAAAAGGSACPPPPPPPPPNDNNNNNKPKSAPNTNERRRRRRRREELNEEINNLRHKVDRQCHNNNSLHGQVHMLTMHNGNLREMMDEEIEPEPEQVQIQFPEDSEDDLELQGATAAPSPTMFFDEECPEDLPLRFDGNPDMLGQFISQCQLFMERSTTDFSVDRVRVCFVTSMLTGRAARWASAKLERAAYLMNNYDAFMMELKLVFEDPQRRETAKRMIRRLRQGPDSVADYANNFQTIALDLDWHESSLIDQFLEGLGDEMHEELAHQEIPNTLSELISLCIYIERRQARDAADAAAANKPRADPPRALVLPQTHQTDPTEPVGGARMRLTQEEKERRRKLNLCLYCGSGGHYADNCPAKASKNSPPGNSPAPL
ncbi:hypothetical protein STEG23_012129 [Scotinomys teguina]